MSLYPSFARPRTLAQAGELLASLSTGTVIIAGGQELMPSVNTGVLQPDVYVDVGALKELRGIRHDDVAGVLRIGALTVHRELQTEPLVQAHAPLLAASAIKAGGGRQVHNRGTIGGNIVSMHPLYDIAPSLLALGAQVELFKDGEMRTAGFADLLKDTSHGLGSEAILVAVLVPAMKASSGYGYEKLKMSGGAYGSANAAAIVDLDGGTVAAVRLSIGAVSERLIDASPAGAASVMGKPWSEATATALAEAVSALVAQPLSDQQGDGDWRRAMAGIVAQRAVGAAVSRAGKGS